MQRISAKQSVAAFVLGATALIGTSVPALAQQGENDQKIQRKQQRQKAAPQTEEQTAKPRTRETRDIQVQPKRRIQEQAPTQTQVTPRERTRIESPREIQVTPRRQTQVEPRQAPNRTQVNRTPRVQVPERTQVDRTPRVQVPDRSQTQIQLPRRDGNVKERRLSDQAQRQQIDLQRRRFNDYNQRLERQRQLAQARADYLRQQRRMQQWQFQQEYQRRLYEQQLRIAQMRNYNYYNDPFYYTAPSYRYSRAGSWYQVNSYAANILQEAINNGYSEGYRAGRADRLDGWRFSYQDSFAWEDANFGFPGYYVDQSEYNHYFREGFQRGYEDGYYGRYQYGRYSNGRYSILGAVLSAVLNFESLVD